MTFSTKKLGSVFVWKFKTPRDIAFPDGIRVSVHGFNLTRAVVSGVMVYFVAENLILWARSEIIGYAICPSYLWFQVSGVRCQ